MTLAVLLCKGIPVLWILTGQMQCIDRQATPVPQRVVCSGPSVPVITVPDYRALPPQVQRFMAKAKKNRIDHHCPETVTK